MKQHPSNASHVFDYHIQKILLCNICKLPLQQHLKPHTQRDDDDTSLSLSLKKISTISSCCSGDYGHDDDVMT